MVDRLAPASLMLMAVLWGSTFFVLKDMLARMDASDLLAVRFTIAALLLVVVLRRRLRMDATTVRHGLVMGALYGAGQLLQTYGLAQTSASISGFLTGLYVVMTPILEAVLLKARVGRRVWLAVALATAGLGLLTLMPGVGATRFGWGEFLTVLSALAYAGHIAYTGRVSTQALSLPLSTVQTVTVAAVCVLAALPGGIALPQRAADWWAVLYLAVLCGALAIVLQVWAQARVEATRAAVIMSSEPIWAAFFAIAAGQEEIGWRTLVGGAAMVCAMMLASLPEPARLPGIRAARAEYRERPPELSGSTR
ncbi:MAG: DMT family transporter [Brooklawnia sp.]|uniref:DMT family transporter n=1 Tax=Brooklawnia sp. TaxID=2699740 RepID=UPI003C71F26A